MWKGICRAHTIPKDKSYMWKYATNAITVKSILTRRGLPNVSLECPICGDVETREHMTFGCRWTRAIWFRVLGIRGAYQNAQNMEQWLNDFMNELGSMTKVSQARWGLCMTTCWHIWKARCQAMFEAKMSQPRFVISEIKVSVEEFGKLPKQQPSTQVDRGSERWCAP